MEDIRAAAAATGPQHEQVERLHQADIARQVYEDREAAEGIAAIVIQVLRRGRERGRQWRLRHVQERQEAEGAERGPTGPCPGPMQMGEGQAGSSGGSGSGLDDPRPRRPPSSAQA